MPRGTVPKVSRLRNVDNLILDELEKESLYYHELRDRLVREAPKSHRISEPTLAKHLRTLADSGLVAKVPYGSARLYKISEPFPGLLATLKELDKRVERLKAKAKRNGGQAFNELVEEVIVPSIHLLARVYFSEAPAHPGPRVRAMSSSVVKWVNFLATRIVGDLVGLIEADIQAEDVLNSLAKSDPRIADLLRLRGEVVP